MQDNKLIIGSYIFLIAVSWGFSWPLIKIGLDYMGPFTFSAFRFVTGGLTLLVFLMFLYRPSLSSFNRKEWGSLIVLGFLQTFAVFGFITYALMFVEAGKTSIILYTMPIWSSILAPLFLKETMTKQNAFGLLLGTAGLVFIIGNDIFLTSSIQNIIGILLVLLAAICWASATIYLRLKLSHANQLAVNAYQMLLGGVVFFIPALFLESDQTIHWTKESTFAVLFTGIVASALCFSLWYYLLKIINTVTATISTMLVPVFGVIFGNLLLNEAFTFPMAIGGFCILSGIFISQVRFPKKQNKKIISH